MALPSRYEGLDEKIPGSLGDLRGPAEGVVPLPPHLVWSGMTEFDLAEPMIRMSMYRIVITTGCRTDYETYLNAGHLRGDWALLRRGLGPAYRHAWEKKLPLWREAAV
ncbi:hypothetical protein HD597_008306 [Nonomuraea thailandensis]|uniref:Uncharacterized protein n=1 Tax=Nonomuraea thailandensis TaxID=1188745 RepID=A0A9X2K8Y9_9ACTN|nr:hypothetical protein [Nonomuraea thailandensis]MCP2361286.1 hypothetical protein [Nonomuraea thailandensis]